MAPRLPENPLPTGLERLADGSIQPILVKQEIHHHHYPEQQPAPQQFAPVAARRGPSAGTVAAVAGGAVAVVAVLATVTALLIALAIAGVCLTTCTLILRKMWRDYLKDRGQS